MLERLISESSQTSVQMLWFCMLLQGSLLGYDEIVLHRHRDMPAWERWGHPIDSFFFLLPFAVGGFFGAELPAWVFMALAVVSSLVIMKDEWVHVGRINALESFLHAGLFLLHPVTLFWGYQSWKDNYYVTLSAIALILFCTMILQAVFWNALEPRLHRKG